jgi:hypothetical protein
LLSLFSNHSETRLWQAFFQLQLEFFHGVGIRADQDAIREKVHGINEQWTGPDLDVGKKNVKQQVIVFEQFGQVAYGNFSPTGKRLFFGKGREWFQIVRTTKTPENLFHYFVGNIQMGIGPIQWFQSFQYKRDSGLFQVCQNGLGFFEEKIVDFGMTGAGNAERNIQEALRWLVFFSFPVVRVFHPNYFYCKTG